MVTGFRLICPAGEVAEAGKGVRLTVSRYGREVPAFVIRFQGGVHVYINECGHVPA